MTSEQLYELCVGHIGKAWWPAMFDEQAWKDLHADQSFVKSAEAMIFGSAVMWLIGEGYHRFEFEHNSDTDLVGVTLYDEPVWAEHGLAAVLAACAAVEGGQ